MIKALVAEALGTFSWVGAVCAAMLVTGEGNFSVGAIIATALCVGFTIAAMTAVLRGLSPCHFNPAVSLAAVITGQLGPGRAAGYVAAQVFGGALAALLVFLALSTTAGYMPVDFAANGYGRHSPSGFSAGAVFATELVLAGLLALIVLALSEQRGEKLWAAVLIGGAVAAMHLVSVQIDNTSLNPARSTATALFAEGWALSQLWMFWLAPMAGGALGGLAARWLLVPNSDNP